MAKQSLQVHILDERGDCRTDIKRVLDVLDRLCAIVETQSVEAAQLAITDNLPHLLLIDIGACQGNAMEFIRKLRLGHPEVRILVYTHQDEQLYAERALRIGAHGYLMKPAEDQQLKNVIRNVLNGELYVSSNVESKILHHLAGQEEESEVNEPEILLSNRELEVFVKIGEGFSSRDIAKRMGLSIKTVETHRAHIKRKMHLHGARDLVQHARDWVARTSRAQEALQYTAS